MKRGPTCGSIEGDARCPHGRRLLLLAAEATDPRLSWTPASTWRLLLESDSFFPGRTSGGGLMDQRTFFGLAEQLEALSRHGDPLEVLDATVDFEFFRGWLVEGLGYGDGSNGGRPPFDPVSMFKALILQTQHNLSDARMSS
jgi:hypothetical protein